MKNKQVTDITSSRGVKFAEVVEDARLFMRDILGIAARLRSVAIAGATEHYVRGSSPVHRHTVLRGRP